MHSLTGKCYSLHLDHEPSHAAQIGTTRGLKEWVQKHIPLCIAKMNGKVYFHLHPAVQKGLLRVSHQMCIVLWVHIQSEYAALGSS